MAILSPEVVAFMRETREQFEELQKVISKLYMDIEELKDALGKEEE